MSSSKAEDHTNLQEGRPVDSGSEIPRQGRSPDFVLRGSALPGFPVVRTHTPAIWPVRRFLCRSAPVHSDCIAPDSHRIPFSPASRRTPRRYNFIFFSDSHIITRAEKLSIRRIAGFPVSLCGKTGSFPARHGLFQNSFNFRPGICYTGRSKWPEVRFYDDPQAPCALESCDDPDPCRDRGGLAAARRRGEG